MLSCNYFAHHNMPRCSGQIACFLSNKSNQIEQWLEQFNNQPMIADQLIVPAPAKSFQKVLYVFTEWDNVVMLKIYSPPDHKQI